MSRSQVSRRQCDNMVLRRTCDLRSHAYFTGLVFRLTRKESNNSHAAKKARESSQRQVDGFGHYFHVTIVQPYSVIT